MRHVIAAAGSRTRLDWKRQTPNLPIDRRRRRGILTDCCGDVIDIRLKANGVEFEFDSALADIDTKARSVAERRGGQLAPRRIRAGHGSEVHVDHRIRHTSHTSDIAILIILWVQLTVGLITLPYSWQHADGSVMLILADWAQRIMTLRPVDAAALATLPWPFLFHVVLGMTIFLILPFSRLVHVWSGFGAVSYLFRPYQVVRSRRLNVPEGRTLPGQPSAVPPPMRQR
jgi:hypothetical protein